MIYDVAVLPVAIGKMTYRWQLDIGDLSRWLVKYIVLPPAANGHSFSVLLPLLPLFPAAKPVVAMLPSCT